jgi:hypothetical protein
MSGREANRRSLSAMLKTGLNRPPALLRHRLRSGARWAGCVVFGLVVAATFAVGGFYFGALHADWIANVAGREVAPLEHFLLGASFSEADTARDELQAAASRFIAGLDIPRARTAGVRSESGSLANPDSDAGSTMDVVVSRLRQGIEQFRGTEQELVLIQHLLWTLRSRAARGPWLDAYLDAAYRHPTHAVVGRNAAEAWQHAQVTGRVEEVSRAFRHLQSIPFDHPAKAVVDYLLGQPDPRSED